VGPFIMAWLIGEGIISYRAIKKTKAPPVPGALLASSGLFALLALLAESDAARPLATVLAYGFDVAAFMNLYPPVTGGAATVPAAGATAAAAGTAGAGAGAGSPTLATPPQSG
jgi:hypothetical protein